MLGAHFFFERDFVFGVAVGLLPVWDSAGVGVPSFLVFGVFLTPFDFRGLALAFAPVFGFLVGGVLDLSPFCFLQVLRRRGRIESHGVRACSRPPKEPAGKSS